MPLYTLKKPMVVEARRFDGTEPCALDLHWWVHDVAREEDKTCVLVEVTKKMDGKGVSAVLHSPRGRFSLEYGDYVFLHDGIFCSAKETEFLEHFEPHFVDRTIP